MKETRGEKIFRVINAILLTLIGLICVYPFVYVLSASLSSGDAISTGKVLLFPKEFTLSAYDKVIANKSIWMGYGNTLFYTFVGTAVNLLITICGAYPLSKKRLPGRKFINIAVVITMWFNAGMIPFYLNIKDLGLLNNRWTMIIAFACASFNMILLRTFFESVPNSLEEAAKVDGASDFTILTKIYLPLSKAALATIGLFYGVSRWNGYFWAMVLLKDDNKVPLQVVLKKMIVEMNVADELSDAMDITTNFSAESVMYATIVISVIPMLLVYPFIQKYFAQGVMVGSIKG